MKKFLAVILAVCMMFSVTSFAFAASGEEVDVEPDFVKPGSKTDNHVVKNVYGVTVGEVLVTVYFTYD